MLSKIGPKDKKKTFTILKGIISAILSKELTGEMLNFAMFQFHVKATCAVQLFTSNVSYLNRNQRE